MKTFFKIFAVIFAVLFVWAVVLQYNDPDALLWYVIYGLAALGSVVFTFGRLNLMIATLLCVTYLVGGFLSWPETFEGFEIGAGDIVNVERGREACGLLIVASVFLVYALRIRYKSKRFENFRKH
ncbi:Transmembrane family 220, helix [Pricia antarctica]|uniref:Transmembrane family 220, helix n=1 Tax=Pricia antarctica TaxID=641691 RepID=A0A1G7FU78_9FLAO|nr:transmembrane 220 family protein [Pricia antarctica]SDE79411.1 Transmembrane family 220, helix [Pricia antarctica]